jgi:predicted AAA+ superfamily ATPase
LLEKSYIISTINPFFGDKKIENSKKQKLYFQNFAIPNYFLSSFEKNIFS